MDKKTIWLLYDRQDLLANRDFAQLMKKRGLERAMNIRPLTLEELSLRLDENGIPYCLVNGKRERPDGVLSRMREPLFSHHLESMGVPVFNCARVCEICNDKRRTLQFLAGLPMPATRFIGPASLPPESFPAIVKPAASHGGDRVSLAESPAQWRDALAGILPLPAMEQRVVKKPGRDLRVYVLFGKIVAAVMRVAKTGVVSNYKLGGTALLHTLEREERQLAEEVISRFAAAGAALSFAGVDLLYESFGPVVSEVEDVVGSRMLYQVSRMDIVSLFLDGVRQRV